MGWHHASSSANLCVVLCAAGFLDRLRIELRLQGQLQGLGLSAGTVQKLLETRLDDNSDGLGDLRLDLSPMKQVQYWNGILSKLPDRNANGLSCCAFVCLPVC